MTPTKEKKQSTYIPPEILQRVFFQHTDPNELWTVGRQVCSMWRSEIPKVFAKKYLENPDMVQIYFDLGCQRIEGVNCFMAAEMVFDRYEGEAKERCVFAEHSTTSGSARRNSEVFSQKYERTKSSIWRNGLSMYLGGDPGARRTLSFDVKKREISFEWEAMFTQFFLESKMLADAELEIMTESMKWVEDAENQTITGTLAHTKKRTVALHNVAKNVRRHRIKRFYLDNHNFVYPDRQFDEEAENEVLKAIHDHELHGDFTRCMEDRESKERAEAHAASQSMFDMMNMVRESQGVREDDENGLMAMLMQLMGAGGPPGDEADDDEDDDEDEDEDGDDVSEEEYVIQDEWTDWTPTVNE